MAVLFILWAPVLRAQSVALPPADPAERIEAGRARLLSGPEVVYRIRLLPLASFRGLPAGIVAGLEKKGCMVPQTYQARQPENVIRGSFEKKGSSDWAVLCSVDGMTTLYVFFQSKPEEPIMLRRQRDVEWLGAEVVGEYGSAWGISRLSPSQIRASRPGPGNGAFDHDAIEDAFVDHASSIEYFRQDAWATLQRRD